MFFLFLCVRLLSISDTEVETRKGIREEYCQAKTAWDKKEKQLMEEQTSLEAKKQEYWNKSETHTRAIEGLKHQIKSLEVELQSKEQGVREFSLACGKLKQELDATESKLLHTTRSRNILETELSEEKRAHIEKVDNMSFQMEQLKASHAKAVQEILVNLQEERKKHQQHVKELTTQQEHTQEQLQVWCQVCAFIPPSHPLTHTHTPPARFPINDCV